MMPTAEMETVETVGLTEPFIRLKRDMRDAAQELGAHEARWLVDAYYMVQDERIRSAAQWRQGEKAGESHRLAFWLFGSMRRFEAAIKAALGEFASQYRIGVWLQGVHGIGPVISAALLSNFDIRKALTVGHFWRFAGLDPTCKWEKKTKRPWNAQLKSICAFKMGECFVKFSGNEKCFYGRLYADKKLRLIAQNEAGEFAETVQRDLDEKRYKPTTEAHKHLLAGHLPPAQIHARARRWAVKLFLSHLHALMYRDFHNAEPPAPYIFDHPNGDDHRHLLEPPEWPGEWEGKPLRKLYG